MKITSLKIRVLKNTGTKLKGIASIVLDNMIAIHDIKILEGSENYFLAMPSRMAKNGECFDIVHPINAETRKSVENIIIAAYKESEKQNYISAQFEVTDNIKETLLDQTFQDFYIVHKVENYLPNTIYRPIEREVEPDNGIVEKKTISFFDWLKKSV